MPEALAVPAPSLAAKRPQGSGVICVAVYLRSTCGSQPAGDGASEFSPQTLAVPASSRTTAPSLRTNRFARPNVPKSLNRTPISRITLCATGAVI